MTLYIYIYICSGTFVFEHPCIRTIRYSIKLNKLFAFMLFHKGINDSVLDQIGLRTLCRNKLWSKTEVQLHIYIYTESGLQLQFIRPADGTWIGLWKRTEHETFWYHLTLNIMLSSVNLSANVAFHGIIIITKRYYTFCQTIISWLPLRKATGVVDNFGFNV